MNRWLISLWGCLAIACSSTNGSGIGPDAGTGPDGDIGHVCKTDKDCTGFNPSCAFKASDGCSAKGRCVTTNTGGTCDAAVPLVCACNGTTQALGLGWCGLPAGYYDRPVLHDGVCASREGGHD